jgi:hypothetical protein
VSVSADYNWNVYQFEKREIVGAVTQSYGPYGPVESPKGLDKYRDRFAFTAMPHEVPKSSPLHSGESSASRSVLDPALLWLTLPSNHKWFVEIPESRPGGIFDPKTGQPSYLLVGHG